VGVCLTTHFQDGKSKASLEDEDIDEDLERDPSAASRKPIATTFELNDTLYAEAELEDSDVVYLWLGVCCLLRSHCSLSEYLIAILTLGKCDAFICTPGGY
jgi:hypothetical protein